MADYSSSRPRIGVTAWLRSLPTYLGERTELYTLGKEYADRIKEASGIPFILPHGDAVDPVLDVMDGLLLTGGDDVHPASYGAQATSKFQGIDLEADRWEIELVRNAARRRMPVLGICRGMQIMAVAFGGTLLPDVAGQAGHPDVSEMSPEEILAERHDVHFESACAIATLYGTSTRRVNTIHHQAVADAGSLKVTGHGPGGMVEAVESPEDWPALGVQWHPEKMDDTSERRLFEHLIERSLEYGQARSMERDGASRDES